MGNKKAKLARAEAPMAEVGMKTKRKRTELSGATFVFILFFGSGNKYRNTGNKYGNKYCQKQIHTKYGTETEQKTDIYRNREMP